jgi:exonuclease VII large subunit
VTVEEAAAIEDVISTAKGEPFRECDIHGIPTATSGEKTTAQNVRGLRACTSRTDASRHRQQCRPQRQNEEQTQVLESSDSNPE